MISDSVLYPRLRLPDGSLLATVVNEPVEITIEPGSPVAVVRASFYVESVEGSLWVIPPSQGQEQMSSSSVSGVGDEDNTHLAGDKEVA